MTTDTDIAMQPAVVGVTIYSSRPAELAAFYARVIGTSLDGGVDHLTGEALFRAQLGGLEFEVIGSNTALGSGAVQPSVLVPDVTAAVQRALDADGSVHLGAAEHSWGSYAIVMDPDGNRLGLYAPAEDASNSESEDTA
ncbi:MAG: Glyoxalase-like domain [Thermoleophilia bacterium]|nr:Glyoxalase-like domain [Thermoleophilia bacterium]MCW2971989.1 Glyoxalase-like domain [Thermoleophilia bacterium]